MGAAVREDKTAGGLLGKAVTEANSSVLGVPGI